MTQIFPPFSQTKSWVLGAGGEAMQVGASKVRPGKASTNE
jgi:hypothetical protein